MNASSQPLRVALVAGCLVEGGAEKQLVYMARALTKAGAHVRVYSLTQGDYYESVLGRLGLQPIWVGRRGRPLARLAALTSTLRRDRPHIVQCVHSYVNLYSGLAARLLRVASVGAMRGSLANCRQQNGRWCPWLIRANDALVVNSAATFAELSEAGLVAPRRLFRVPNVIDLDDHADDQGPPRTPRPTAVWVGRLVPVKRVDRFLRTLALAQQQAPDLCGLIVGDGPQRAELERLAASLRLSSSQVQFLGTRHDVPRLLAAAEMLVLCSESEGFPNVLLEAMAASRPVITTAVGDAADLIEHGVNGYVVDSAEPADIAAAMVRLAGSPHLRDQLGRAGREKVKAQFGLDRLAERLFSVYRQVAGVPCV